MASSTAIRVTLGLEVVAMPIRQRHKRQNRIYTLPRKEIRRQNNIRSKPDDLHAQHAKRTVGDFLFCFRQTVLAKCLHGCASPQIKIGNMSSRLWAS